MGVEVVIVIWEKQHWAGKNGVALWDIVRQIAYFLMENSMKRIIFILFSFKKAMAYSGLFVYLAVLDPCKSFCIGS